MRFVAQLSAASALVVLTSASPIEHPDIKESFTVQETEPKPLKSGPSALISTYMKFNQEAPAEVLAAAAANDGTVTNNPANYDSQYLAPVSIGGQSLMLDFDTGSADLWVFSSELTSTERTGHQIYDPSRSPTSQIKGGYSWRIRYGDGSSASGDVYTDTVQVGGTTVRDQAIELASTISAQFQRNMNDDGLLGLAFSTINTVSPSKQKTFFESAKASLSSPLFTVDLKKGEPGTYTFGTIDSSKYSGQIAYVPVDPSRGFWSFTTAGYAIGEDAPSSSPFRAIADTGTTLLLLPDDVVRSYYNQVPSASYTPSQGGYTFACGEDLPSVTIVIGNYDAVVPGPFIEYAPIDDTATTCFGGIQSDIKAGFSILGDIFLKSQFVVFDGSSSPRIGFAAKPL